MNSTTYEDLITAVAKAMTDVPGVLALLLVEVADYRDLQARLGYARSGLLIKQIGVELASALGARAAAIERFGDASFCALVHGMRNPGHAMLAAEKLVRVADQTMSEAELGLKPQCHVGISLHPQHAQEAGELLRKAQLAAVAARDRSLRVLVFDESCAEQIMRPWTLREAFAAAIDSGGLSIYYQPKVHIASGRPAGGEALMRWMHENRIVATPDVFIPLAEQAGLIQATTWYTLSAALREASEWPLPDLGVAVNIAPSMLHHKDFIDMVRSAISTWKVRGRGLTLEITEGAIIADFAQATARLSQLRDLGVRISIDDFGTGYSSLSYFKKIPAHELKIDKSFIMNMLQDQADQRLVETILALARQFGLEVVAEGVEDQPTLDRLAAMGCDYAQGYFFAPALAQERFREWLKQRGR